MSALFLQRAALPLKAAPGATRRKSHTKRTRTSIRSAWLKLVRRFCRDKVATGQARERGRPSTRQRQLQRAKICPRKIAGDWKLGKELVGEQSADGDDEADPDRPIPFPFHVDLAVVNRKIHR